MNNQEVYDTVKLHLLTQKEKSENSVGQCLYRAPDGRKCAIGALIPDNIYSPLMEHKSVDGLATSFPIIKRFFRGIDFELLFELQVIHDKYGPNTWEKELADTAKTFHLNP